MASVLAICLFGIPLGAAVLKCTLQHERSHLVQLGKVAVVWGEIAGLAAGAVTVSGWSDAGRHGG